MVTSRRHEGLSPVLLAGGSGTRLWPLSRRTVPKHLIALTGERTLLALAAERALGAADAAHVLTVGAVDQAELLAAQLADVDAALPAGLLLEPAARNTAAACVAAALHARSRFGSQQVLWVCAADHVIGDVDALHIALTAAIAAARDGRLVTFGISPAYPEPGFGYIRTGAPLTDHADVCEVAAFIEKPPRAEAERMLAAGGHLWNSGMFVFEAGTFLAEVEAHAPAILAATFAAVEAARGAPTVFGEAYAGIPAAPVDKAVMERSDRLAVVPCDPLWSDVGSWRAVWETRPHDAAGNAVSGDVVVENSGGCLVLGGDRLVAAVDVNELAIVDTGDALLVAARDGSASIKSVVERLEAEGRAEAASYPHELGAWGERRALRNGKPAVRELTLRPGRARTLSAPPNCALFVFGPGLDEPLILGAGQQALLTNDTDITQTFVEVEAGAGDRPPP